MILRRSVRLEINGPVLSRSNAVGAFGVDVPIARTFDDRPYLPGTLILGRLVEAFEHLGAAQMAARKPNDKSKALASFHRDLKEFFAHGSTGDAGDEKRGRDRRRRISISDFIAETKPNRPEGTRTRIACDMATGSVMEGALQVIETPFVTGEKVSFLGEVRVIGRPNEVEAFASRLETAFRWVTQWGALRSIGFGEAVSVTFPADDNVREKARPSTSGAPDRLTLRLSFADPLCVGERRIAPNIFESAAVISGGVIRGALASQLLARHGLPSGAFLMDQAKSPDKTLSTLAKAMPNIRFSHAFPVPKPCLADERPCRVPFSLVEAETGLFDLASLDDPSTPVLIEGRAPKFSPDWKNWAKINALVGWSEPDSDFRVRTRIDPDTRAAAPENLFAIEYRRSDTHDWIADIDITGVERHQRESVALALEATLTDGLFGVGRGGAFARAHVSRRARRASSWTERLDGRVVLTLQTSTLLRRPEPGATGDVTKAYEEALRGLLPSNVDSNALRLLGVFVRERLSGAEFMHMRRDRAFAYRPFLLTEPGSVFVIAPSGALKACIEEWLTRGLATPPATLAFYGLENERHLWRVCPFVPENGYGEVTAGAKIAEGDHSGEDMHEALRPNASVRSVRAVMDHVQ